MKRRLTRWSRRRALLFACVAAITSTLACSAPWRAYADCAPSSNDTSPQNASNSASEWVTYCQQDGEEYSYSSSACFSFQQDYAKLNYFYVFDYCNWEPGGGYNWDYFGNYFFASMTDVVDSYGNNGGIPFSVDFTQSGTGIWDHYHQRNNEPYKYHGMLNDSDSWPGAPIYDTNWDQYSAGSTTAYYDDEWDPQYQGNVVSSSSEAVGGRNTWFVGVQMDDGN